VTKRRATEPASDCESLIASGIRALDGDGDLRASRLWFERAHQSAVRSGDADVMAIAALGLCGLWVHEHRTAAAAVMLQSRLRRALSLADPHSSLALRLRIRLAGESDYRSGGRDEILALLQEATRAADPVARAEALSLAHHCVLGPDHGPVRRELATELIGESHQTGRRSDLLMGLLWQTVDMLLDAEPHAERRLGEVRDLLAQRDHLAVSFVVGAIDVMLAIRSGRLDEAQELAEVCAQRGTATGDVDATGWYGAQLVAIRWYQGRLAELLPALDVLTRSPTLSAVDNSFVAALAVAAALAGDRQKAVGALATLRGTGLEDLPRSSSWLATMNGIVEAAHLLRDADTAAQAYKLLWPFAHLPMMASLGAACFGSVEHALGVAALTIGDADRAVEHLRAAVERNLALRHWPAVVMSRLRHAEALTLRGHPRDVAGARRELAAAAEEATALGMSASGQVSVQTHEPAAAACRRAGRRWRIEWGRRNVLVEHSVGMLHLAVLLANPGQEIAAIDLVAGVAAVGASADRSAMSAQPVLDRVAAQQYRDRLSRLSADIDDLESDGDLGGAARARAERDWLLNELAGATGIGGRSRRFTDDTERARIAAGKALRRALTRIEEADTFIGEHLRGAVHTGVRCCYRPS
jgi:hypothetical protein